MKGTVIRRRAGQRPARVVVPEVVEVPRRRGWVGLREDVQAEMQRLGADPRPTWRDRY